MSGPTLDELVTRDPIPAPSLPFVVEEEAPLVLYIRRRDGWRYEIGPRLHELPDEYRERVELHCRWFNDTYDYAAREERRRAQANDRAATAAFVGGPDLLDTLIDIARTTQAAE